MTPIVFIVIFALVILAGLMVYLAILKQWATLLTLAGIFSAIVTGAYAYYKIPSVSNTVQNIVGK